MIISGSCLLDWEILRKTVEEIRIHVFGSVTFFFPKSCCLWDKVEISVEPDRPQMTIRRICTACWLPNPTSTRLVCITLTAFPRQTLSHEWPSLIRYTYTACLVQRSLTQHESPPFQKSGQRSKCNNLKCMDFQFILLLLILLQKVLFLYLGVSLFTPFILRKVALYSVETFLTTYKITWLLTYLLFCL